MPLWGGGDLQTQDACRALEQQVISDYPEFAKGLEVAGLKQERRALRVEPRFFQLQVSGSELFVNFELPPGSYATAVLHELLKARDTVI